MFGIAAVVLFTIAAILSGTATHVSSTWFQPATLMLFGLACLAVHLLPLDEYRRRFVR